MYISYHMYLKAMVHLGPRFLLRWNMFIIAQCIQQGTAYFLLQNCGKGIWNNTLNQVNFESKVQIFWIVSTFNIIQSISCNFVCNKYKFMVFQNTHWQHNTLPSISVELVYKIFMEWIKSVHQIHFYTTKLILPS